MASNTEIRLQLIEDALAELIAGVNRPPLRQVHRDPSTPDFSKIRKAKALIAQSQALRPEPDAETVADQ